MKNSKLKFDEKITLLEDKLKAQEDDYMKQKEENNQLLTNNRELQYKNTEFSEQIEFLKKNLEEGQVFPAK